MAIDAAAAGQLNDSEPIAPQSDPTPRRAILLGLTLVVALAILLLWLGFRVHQAEQTQAQRGEFLQVATQGAVNLTTIDWRHADADVHRILDGATGEFRDDFARRSGPFIDVLRQAQSSTVGSVTESGLESQTADTAQALVEVSVQTSNAGAAEPVPRVWRMRITVAKVGDQVKVSSVRFVP
ncbi:mammalian cell entry protein [Mycobacterium asiaticum]|uniref:Mammalian cell entry protein n=1 Tax=Mycobacterium asiaticum TaxID=1790 RepID=A0A1A3NJ82_MYCAS|nr:mammalian cell entry protein [Mycobacterium asiaticum]OBK21390.1 mammalian cell entry protein [Mycobacterium asiaticum]